MQILPARFYSWTFKTSSLTLPALYNLFIDLHHAQNKILWPLNPMAVLFPTLQLLSASFSYSRHTGLPAVPQTLEPLPTQGLTTMVLPLWPMYSADADFILSPSCLLREAFSTTHLICFCAPQLSILRLIHFLSKRLWLSEIILSI